MGGNGSIVEATEGGLNGSHLGVRGLSPDNYPEGSTLAYLTLFHED